MFGSSLVDAQLVASQEVKLVMDVTVPQPARSFHCYFESVVLLRLAAFSVGANYIF
jgi:hypothetical protein